jgi:hypothetical protein
MKFLAYSMSFKILLVASTCVSIFEIGIRNEGMGKSYPAIAVGWFNQIFSTIPVPYGWPDSLIFSLTNAFFFYGSFFCLFVIHKYIRQGQFSNQGWKSFLVILALTFFSLLTVAHYVEKFLNQKRYYVESNIVFATTDSMWAFNAYDNIIAIAILLQIAQASINTGLKRVSKRQLSTGVSPTISSTSD